MANIRLHKQMKVRKIKDDSLVNPTIQELQMNLEQIERGIRSLYVKRNLRAAKCYKDTYRGIARMKV
jgi:glucosamine--fructose-6-phosphate aminotransferase (isomerizing)